jgi:hypothetical protein
MEIHIAKNPIDDDSTLLILTFQNFNWFILLLKKFPFLCVVLSLHKRNKKNMILTTLVIKFEQEVANMIIRVRKGTDITKKNYTLTSLKQQIGDIIIWNVNLSK